MNLEDDPWEYAASPKAVQELFTGGGEFNPPARVLCDLTEERAVAVYPGAPHSIAQIVAHMLWNLDGVLGELRGKPLEDPEHLEDTFAAPEAGEWSDLVERFLAANETCNRIAVERAEETSPARNDTNVGYDLAEAALHNAYHLGQIVLLRQMMGLWPPRDGDLNDL